MRPLLVVALVSCSNSPASQPPASRATSAPASVAHTAEVPDVVSEHADGLAVLAKELDDTASLTDLRDAVAAIHALDRYKQAVAHASEYRPVEPLQIDVAIATRHALARRFASSAQLLRADRIAEAIEPLGRDLDDAFATSLGHLSGDLVDELEFDRTYVCTRSLPCDGLEKISTAFEIDAELGPRLRRALDGAADDIAAAVQVDEHTRVVLLRAADRGPAFGAACGPENLCGENNTCQRATHTCEARCYPMAMEPCPGDRACTTVAGITESVCR